MWDNIRIFQLKNQLCYEMERLLKIGDVDKETEHKFFEICSRVKLKCTSMVASGIGDILMYKIAYPHSPININFHHISTYKPYPENIFNIVFNYELISKLFKNVNYYYHPTYNIQYMDYSLLLTKSYDLSDYFNINSYFDFDYVVIHTKLRLSSDESQYIKIKNEIAELFREYKCPLPIVVLGERILPKNAATMLWPFMTTVYNEIMLLEKNNKIIDLSVQEMYNTPNMEQFEKDISIISNATLNIGLGLGGQFCINSIFSKKTVYYIPDNVQNKYVKPLGLKLCSDIHNFSNNLP